MPYKYDDPVRDAEAWCEDTEEDENEEYKPTEEDWYNYYDSLGRD